METGSSKGAVSFGFKKKIESKVDESKVLKETSKEDNEFLEEVSQVSLSQKPAKKEIVIPLIQRNRWKNVEENGSSTSLEAEAAKEIIAESAQFLDNATSNTDTNKEFENLAVPLLLKNKVPDGFETDEKLNVALRPDEASIKDYEDIPIEAFGMAMLRGMGWDPEVGIGRTFKQNVKMLETAVRPKGLGLGASVPHPTENSGKRSNKSSSESEVLEIKKHAYVCVQSGSHKRKYGVVEGIDSDNAQCIVKFALGGKSATVGIHALKPVSKSEYSKYGKDLSRLSKAHAMPQNSIFDQDKSKSKKLDQSDTMSDTSVKHKKQKKADSEYKKYKDESRKHKSKDEDVQDETKHKHKSKKRSKTNDNSPPYCKHAKKQKTYFKDSEQNYSEKAYISHKAKKTWLLPNLRVRMIDERFRKGKYYNQKLIIVDVIDRAGHCCCKTDSGKLLDDIHEDMLETVVPRSNSDAYVVITSRGKYEHDGKLAKILEKRKETCEAYLQLLEDRDVVICVNFDDICEYTGDAEAYHMF